MAVCLIEPNNHSRSHLMNIVYETVSSRQYQRSATVDTRHPNSFRWYGVPPHCVRIPGIVYRATSHRQLLDISTCHIETVQKWSRGPVLVSSSSNGCNEPGKPIVPFYPAYYSAEEKKQQGQQQQKQTTAANNPRHSEPDVTCQTNTRNRGTNM